MEHNTDVPSPQNPEELLRRIKDLELECRRLQRLRRSEPYRELFERSADAILIIKDGFFVDCNQATVEMLHFSSRDQVLQTHPSELSPPVQPDGRDSREKADEMIALAFQNGNHRFEWDHRRADGEVFPVEVLLTSAGNDEEPMLHVVWRDITERKQLEEQLLQSQKMDAIGQLAGGIAHDFNNLLVAIIGNAEILEAAVADQPRNLDRIHQIHQAGTKAAALVRQLLAFSRKQRVHPRIIDLNQLAVDLEQLLRRLIGEDISLVVTVSDAVTSVKIDPGQMEQVIINLITNARDAMPSGGTIHLRIVQTSLEESPPGSSLVVKPGAYAAVEIRDSGTGMDEKTVARAFEPFYTTKPIGKGTGLGLSTVYGIVQRNRGAITLESEIGKGTSITLYLPLAGSPPQTGAPVVPARASRGGNETILVVEDEPTVSTLITRVLESAGYTVRSASDGLDALGVWELHDGPIDLVLSDVVMPNMGGPELVQSLRDEGFIPKVLFMSGYTQLEPERLGKLDRLDERLPFLEKPFTPEGLLKRVREVLDEGG